MRILVVLLAVLAAVAGCKNEATAPIQVPPTVVTVTKPVVREVADFQDFTGQTAAVESVAVRARVSGYLVKINFIDGQEVKKDAPLFQIDPRPYQADWDRTQSELERVQAQLSKATADLARAKKLRPSGAISQEDLDQNIAQQMVAAASVKAAEAAVEQARLNLEYTTITAPIAGRVSRANITVGNLIQPGAADETILTTIVRLDPIYVYFNVDERALLNAQKSARDSGEPPAPDRVDDWKVPVFVGLANEEGFPHEGTLNFVDNQVNPGTGTIRLRAVLKNSDRALLPGLFVRARIYASKPYQAVMVPESVLGSSQGRKYVYVVNGENVVERRFVKPGTLHDGSRVITSGVKPDDRVIVDVQRVRPGLTVDPKLEEGAAATAESVEAGGADSKTPAPKND